MFTCKTKSLNFKLYALRMALSGAIALGWIILSFILPVYGIGPIKFDKLFAEKCFEYGIWFTASGSLFNTVFSHTTQIFLRKKFVYEMLEIIHSVQLPKKMPKVVYVYTTHNDFMPARLLQNMKQKYGNFEVWISDGSTKKEIREEVVSFSRKHNINLYQMPETGSKNKSDNLNSFLEKSGIKFDFLVIADADEVFGKNYISTSVRMFYSKNAKNLAFVSSLNQTYQTKSIFSNVLRKTDDIMLFNNLKRCYSLFDYPNLYSASCMISKKFLKSIGGRFPDGCLEDFYSEAIAAKSNWNGLINPLCVSTQAFDSGVKPSHSRLMRIFDWNIKYQKNKPFENFNEKYIFWFFRYYISLFVPALIIFIIGGIIIMISALIHNWSYFYQSHSLVVSLIVTASTALISFAYLIIFQYGRVIGWKNIIFLALLIPFWGLSLVPYVLKHWFTSTIFSKYSEFGGSPKRFFTKGFMNHLSKIKFDILFAAIFATILITFNYFFITNQIFTTHSTWYASVNVIFGFGFLCYFSTILLYVLSIIPSNRKYNPLNFVNYKNDFVLNKKSIDAFYKKNKVKRLA